MSFSAQSAPLQVYGPCYSDARPPLPLGCGVCGHPPYSHGQGCGHPAVSDHSYEVPSHDQIEARFHLIRSAGLNDRRMPAINWMPPTTCAITSMRAVESVPPRSPHPPVVPQTSVTPVEAPTARQGSVTPAAAPTAPQAAATPTGAPMTTAAPGDPMSPSAPV